ncbi:MAG: ferritin family protein [bacterium]
MNVFEFAMKMEADGRAYYESRAAATSNPALKRIWQQMAEDEIKHYEIFRRFRDGEVPSAAEMATGGTKILEGSKTVFEELSKSEDLSSFGGDEIEAWEKAKQLEVETEKFYREKATEEKDQRIGKSFNLLADEEHKHVHLIEHVLDFLNQPKQWLENAEWSNLGRD